MQSMSQSTAEVDRILANTRTMVKIWLMRHSTKSTSKDKKSNQ